MKPGDYVKAWMGGPSPEMYLFRLKEINDDQAKCYDLAFRLHVTVPLSRLHPATEDDMQLGISFGTGHPLRGSWTYKQLAELPEVPE